MNMTKHTFHETDEVLLRALQEDIGSGDVTALSLIEDGDMSEAVIIAKGDLVLAGLQFAERVFYLVDDRVAFRALKKEGSRIRKGEKIAKIRGKTGSLLSAERTALNILQRTSGIATLTREYVNAVKGFRVMITDTRKTAPGLRFFDKYAVRTGGGRNHRFGLYDGVLIKDNHIAAAGGIGKAVRRVRSGAHHLLKVEIETGSMSEVRDALKAGADVIMLDNMPEERMKKAVHLIRSTDGPVTIEASGGIDLNNVRRVAGTGVDLISVGALTHSAPAADLSLEFLSR